MTTRITGGSHRGRRLSTPSVRGLRPTSERVRAALFSIIGADAVVGKRVVDLYAGTGAIGLDALSRGADWVDFVEQNGKLCVALSERLSLWSLKTRARVHKGKVLKVVSELPGGYDLVIADPPYGSDELTGLVDRLQLNRLLNPGAVVVLEHRSDSAQRYEGGILELETTRTYGDTAITVLSAEDQNG